MVLCVGLIDLFLILIRYKKLVGLGQGWGHGEWRKKQKTKTSLHVLLEHLNITYAISKSIERETRYKYLLNSKSIIYFFQKALFFFNIPDIMC